MNLRTMLGLSLNPLDSLSTSRKVEQEPLSPRITKSMLTTSSSAFYANRGTSNETVSDIYLLPSWQPVSQFRFNNP